MDQSQTIDRLFSLLEKQQGIIDSLNMQLVGIINAQGTMLAQLLANPSMPQLMDDEELMAGGNLN